MSTMSPGASRSSAKMTTDMPKSVSTAMASRCAIYVFTVGGALLVDPHFLHPSEVVDRLVGDQVLDVGPHREVVELPVEDRPGRVGLELLLDVRDHRHPLLRVQLLGLLLDHLADFLVTVVAVVARRAAAVVLEEVGVGVVGTDPGEVGAGLVVAAGRHGMPLRGLDLLERGLDSHLLELVDDERCHVYVYGYRPGDHVDVHRLLGREAGRGET